MRVAELIEALQLLDPTLEVYGYCDHGQTPEKVSYPGYIWTEANEHTLWDGYAGSPDENDGYYPVKAVLL
jgi:hypothetical protein